MSEQITNPDCGSVEQPKEKINLLDLNRQEMRELFAEMGEKPFRADQLMKWIYHFGEENFDNMSNINKVLREKLKCIAEIKAPEVAVEQRSADGTIKWAMQVGSSKSKLFISQKMIVQPFVFLHKWAVHWLVLSAQLLSKVLTAT